MLSYLLDINMIILLKSTSKLISVRNLCAHFWSGGRHLSKLKTVWIRWINMLVFKKWWEVFFFNLSNEMNILITINNQINLKLSNTLFPSTLNLIVESYKTFHQTPYMHSYKILTIKSIHRLKTILVVKYQKMMMSFWTL